MSDNKVKWIIFDFDGTIADTLPRVFKIVNKMALKYGYPEVKSEDIDEWRGKSSKQVVAELKISKLKLPVYLLELLGELNKSIDQVKVFPGIKRLLTNLKSKGYKIGLVTSNSRENIERFLRINNLHFDFIETGVALFGKDKKLTRMINKLGLKNYEVVYVGDETRDIEAANKVSIRIFSVAWGYNTKNILNEHHPDFLANTPSDLSDYFK